VSLKITLIEYDDDIYAGDSGDPNIQIPDYYAADLGGEAAAAKSDLIEKKRVDVETDAKMDGLHDYLFGISSSSSSLSSSSSSSTSSSSSSSSSGA